MVNDKTYRLPKIISVPWIKTRHVRRIVNFRPKGRILIQDGVMYSLDAIINKIRSGQDNNLDKKLKSQSPLLPRSSVKSKSSLCVANKTDTTLGKEVVVELHDKPKDKIKTTEVGQPDMTDHKSSTKRVHFDPDLDSLSDKTCEDF